MGTRKIRTAGAERASALDAATQLMAERTKYEQWLEDLEAKKDSTPAKVFDRVRQDYLTRLQSVMEQLGQHSATLQEHAETLEVKLRELEEAEESNTEEQAEAALRKQVGEITSAEWETGSRKAQRELAKIKENQEVILADLNRIRDLFEDEDEVDEEEETAASPAPAKGSREFNELEFLSSVVGPAEASALAAAAAAAKPAAGPPASASPPVPAPAAPAPPAPPQAPSTARVSVPTTKAATPSTAAPATPPAVQNAPPPEPAVAPVAPVASAPVAAAKPPAPPAAAPTPAAPPANSPPAPTAPAAAAPAPPARVTESPGILRSSVVADQPKTLKCTECSTMNYPSEWYCERCGAELTVV